MKKRLEKDNWLTQSLKIQRGVWGCGPWTLCLNFWNRYSCLVIKLKDSQISASFQIQPSIKELLGKKGNKFNILFFSFLFLEDSLSSRKSLYKHPWVTGVANCKKADCLQPHYFQLHFMCFLFSMYFPKQKADRSAVRTCEDSAFHVSMICFSEVPLYPTSGPTELDREGFMSWGRVEFKLLVVFHGSVALLMQDFPKVFPFKSRMPDTAACEHLCRGRNLGLCEARLDKLCTYHLALPQDLGWPQAAGRGRIRLCKLIGFFVILLS